MNHDTPFTLSNGSIRPVYPELEAKLTKYQRPDRPEACWHYGVKPRNTTKQIPYSHEGVTTNVPAGRLAYYLHHGENVPARRALTLTCGNRDCINPAHMELGAQLGWGRTSPGDPAAGDPAPAVHWRTKLTHCKNGHPLSGDNLYMNGTSRVCRTCKREANAAYAAKARGKAKGQPAVTAPPAAPTMGAVPALEAQWQPWHADPLPAMGPVPTLQAAYEGWHG